MAGARKPFFWIFVGALFWMTLACGERPKEAVESRPKQLDQARSPARIISMAPSITEVIFALGLDDRVVGVSDFCDFPSEALEKSKVGGVVNPNMEAVVALNPDLVLALPNATHENLFRSLQQLGIRVVTLPNDTLEDLFTTIRKIGEVTSNREAAQEMIEQLQSKFSEIRKKVSVQPRRKVMFIVGVEPLFVAGKGTFIDELIEIAGGTNIAGDSFSKYPQLGVEKVVSEGPEVILYTSLNFELTPEQEIKAKALWKAHPSIPAVKNGRIHGLLADYVTLPGPRLVLGVQEMARAIHPELFEQEEQPE
jgi:iron complex transport system substrate-binding protein